MNLLSKGKELLTENTLKILLALITLLLATIWQEGLSAFLAATLVATPKSIVASLLGLIVMIALIEFAYILDLKKQLSGILKKESDKHILKFGVYWDTELNALCPICQKPFIKYARYNNGWGFRCGQCKQTITLQDEGGHSLELTEAKNRLMANSS